MREFSILTVCVIVVQISAKDAASGAVRVEARAPSGRVMDMGVGEVNGVYTANFTPTEVGQCHLFILAGKLNCRRLKIVK